MSNPMTKPQLIAALRARAGTLTQAELARRLGVTPSCLSDVLSGRREPGDKILSACGLTRVVTYEKKGTQG